MVVVVVNEIFLSVRHCVSTALSLSVCHKSVFHQNAWRRNELVSGMEATEELKSKKKTDMLRSVRKQSGESM